MKRFSFQVALALIGALLLPGCSMLTAQGRREHAYARYVAKCSKGRVKQQRKMARSRARIPLLQPTAPVVTTELGGPESVTNSGDGGGF
jgi:hypothetical protein